jgi:hypothetical protein
VRKCQQIGLQRSISDQAPFDRERGSGLRQARAVCRSRGLRGGRRQHPARSLRRGRRRLARGCRFARASRGGEAADGSRDDRRRRLEVDRGRRQLSLRPRSWAPPARRRTCGSHRRRASGRTKCGSRSSAVARSRRGAIRPARPSWSSWATEIASSSTSALGGCPSISAMLR